MKKVVYTVLLGKDYKLYEPSYKNEDWSFICFTDQDIKSKHWTIKKVEGGLKKSREIKILCDKYIDFDICLYIDAKFKIKFNIDNFVKENLKTNIAVMKHNMRTCSYDEGQFCIEIGKDKKETILKQLEYYKSDGFPKDFGLYAPGIMIRKNEREVNEFMKLWFDEVKKYSYRDIISFSYILWKNPIEIDKMIFRETYGAFNKMNFSKFIKKINTKNCYNSLVDLSKIKAQYNPERFHLWKSLHKGPEKQVLNMLYSPHYRFLKNRNNKSYYQLQKLYGRDDKWIKKKIKKFLGVFESIKSEGFKERIIIVENPLIKNDYNERYEIFEGHHRVACALFLNIKEVPCQVIRTK